MKHRTQWHCNFCHRGDALVDGVPLFKNCPRCGGLMTCVVHEMIQSEACSKKVEGEPQQ